MVHHKSLDRRDLLLGLASIPASSFAGMARGAEQSLLRFIPAEIHAAIADGSNKRPLTRYLQSAFDSGERLTAPPGLFPIDGPIELRTDLAGAGTGLTVFQQLEKGQNGLIVRQAGARLSSFTVDMIYRDDKVPGSCVIVRADRCVLESIEARNANRQGFTGPTSHSRFVNLRAVDCGHRGFNFSEFCNENTFRANEAIDCGFSGFLFGLGSSRNVVDGLRVSGNRTSPGVVVHSAANENDFRNVEIGPPGSDTEPHLEVGAASSGNRFGRLRLIGVNNRGILVRNQNVDRASARVGIQNGPLVGNVFRDISISGERRGRVTAILIMETPSQEHGLGEQVFENIEIDGVDIGIRGGDGSRFANVKFGRDVGRRWVRGPTDRP